MSHRTQPYDIDRMPPGIPYIVSNEAAERFSYYGMKAILMVFMTEHLRNSAGELAPMGDAEARAYFHWFSSSVYLFPIIGAIVADAFLGKYRTILWVSLLYCAGHTCLALGDTAFGVSLLSPREWLFLGLALIALGSGGIKPCVSAHVGDQFGPRNQHLLERVFGWFYFSINLGAALSQLLIPALLASYGPSVAFGVPGVLMGLATFAFWMGRNRFVHIPPAGKRFIEEAFSGTGRAALGKLVVLYVFIAFFWSLFDQGGSAWVLQAKRMDRTLFGVEILPSQVQAANPLLIMVYIPLFTYVIYPLLARVFTLTPLRKIGLGMFLAVPSFLISAYIEARLAAGDVVNIGWQLVAFLVITAAEVLISITALEFSYTQAPNRLKSVVMAVYLLSVWLGNLITAVVNGVIQNPDGSSRISELQYYLLFAGGMGAAAVCFVIVARNYNVQNYVQGGEA
jgi:POT family proton-dependent oligopeptide transporter